MEIPANPLPGGDNANPPLLAKHFRFNRGQVFLTYSQCPLEPLVVLTAITKKWDVIAHIVSREHHKDGNFHIHAYFKFKNKLDLSSPLCFDIEGYHPEIKIMGNKKEDVQYVVAYCGKEGFEIITDIDLELKPTWADILKKAGNKEEFLNLVKLNYPRDYCLNLDRLIACAEYTYRTKIELFKLPENFKPFKVPKILSDWVKYELPKTDRAKCLIIIGESRFGKTSWARSLGTHMFYRNYFSLKDWDDTASYIIFDDMIEMKNHKALLTCMGEVILTDKYKGKERCNNNKPAIFLANEDEPWMDQSYWKINAVKYTIENSLF